MLPWSARLVILLGLLACASGSVFISEIMIEPRWRPEWFTFIELYNDDPLNSSDVSGFSFSGALSLLFL